MSKPTPSGRYAGEFITALTADLQRFLHAMQVSDDLAFFLADAAHSLEEKKQLLRQVFQDSIDPFTLNLLYLLLEENRLDQTAEIARLAESLKRRWLDMLAVRITTALPLAAEEEQALQEMLQKRFGKEILLEKAVDPALIGGAVLRVGDQLYDGSIKSQLAALQKDLLK